MSTDPVFDSLGLCSPATNEQYWMASQHASQNGCHNYTDPSQLAWLQTQAMFPAAWQLQQMDTLSQLAYASSACTISSTLPASVGVFGAALAPASEVMFDKGMEPALEATLAKSGVPASEMSTAPGSPSACDEIEESLLEECGRRQSAKGLGIPPPLPTPTKLDLNAILFEKSRDPMSAHLLSLIKGNTDSTCGKEQGKEILALLSDSKINLPKRDGPAASGAHRRAAAASRAAESSVAAAETAIEDKSLARHRRPRGHGRRHSGRNIH